MATSTKEQSVETHSSAIRLILSIVWIQKIKHYKLLKLEIDPIHHNQVINTCSIELLQAPNKTTKLSLSLQYFLVLLGSSEKSVANTAFIERKDKSYTWVVV